MGCKPDDDLTKLMERALRKTETVTGTRIANRQNAALRAAIKQALREAENKGAREMRDRCVRRAQADLTVPDLTIIRISDEPLPHPEHPEQENPNVK